MSESLDQTGLSCNHPDHAYYENDSVIYHNTELGIRAIVGVRDRPIPVDSERPTAYKRDYYLIIETPLKLTQRVLQRELKRIYRAANDEREYPPEAGPLIREMSEAGLRLDSDRAIEIDARLRAMVADVKPIHETGRRKPGPVKETRLDARNRSIRNQVRAYIRRRYSPREACELVRRDLLAMKRGKPLKLSYIARIAKVSL